MTLGVLAELEEELASTLSTWDALQGKVDTVLVAFEPEGVSRRETVTKRVEEARG